MAEQNTTRNEQGNPADDKVSTGAKQDATARHPGSKDIASWKPGSEADQAKNVGGTGDFGVPVGSGSTRQRDYVSDNTRMSDPGMAKPMDWEHDGVRDHGAGVPDEGTGSGSEGDLDTDFIGVGTGGTAVSATGPGDAAGADDVEGAGGAGQPFAGNAPAGRVGNAVVEPARGTNQTGVHRVGGTKQVREGTVIQTTDVQTGPANQGADAATNPAARGDDSFAAEISSGEAQGQDLGMSPSSDTQGLVPGDNQLGPNSDQKDFPDEG